jgi:head-tail adaptor
MLTSVEMSEIRADQELLMPDSGQISRRTLTSDGMGGQTESWAAQGTAKACRIGTGGRSAEERRIAERVGAVMSYVVTLPAGTDITEADRIVVTPSALSAVSGTRTLEVVGIVRDSVGTCVRAVCVEVR